MSPQLRKAFPSFAIAVCIAGIAWAVSFTAVPPADFSFNNGDDVKTLDPAKATGQPEHRVLHAIFEGLMQNLPDPSGPGPDGNTPLIVGPGVAERYELADDGKTYTFHLRQNAQWSDGTPLTAHDFVWSWQRLLHPETMSEYAYQLKYVVGAEQYNAGDVHEGDRVEVELADRPSSVQTFPRGTIVRGILKSIVKPPEPKATGERSEWLKSWTYVVEVKPQKDGQVDWEAAGEERAFSRKSGNAAAGHGKVEPCQIVLLDFATQVAVQATDDRTLVVRLNSPTPYFIELTAFYPLFPVQRACVEEFGSPGWTKPGKIVSNGAYLLESRRLGNRIRLVKNPRYWDAARVQLNVIDAYPVKSETTALNMYLRGQLDWGYPVPNVVVPKLQGRPDYVSGPMFTTYFYRCNVTRPPLDNPLVRRALNMAIDKRKIVEHVTKAGQLPATSFVPPGMPGYTQPQGESFDIAKARELLAEAGYPRGQGFPKIQILFNTMDAHRAIAEVVQRDWKDNLGIDVELRNLEWGVFLESLSKKDYVVARSAWVADYSDPNTFLDMFVTGGPNNQTGWSNVAYDQLIRDAAREPDSAKRMDMLRKAEELFLREQPILPIYSYVSNNMVQPYVKGFFPNVRDEHPLHLLSIDQEEKRAYLAAGGLGK